MVRNLVSHFYGNAMERGYLIKKSKENIWNQERRQDEDWTDLEPPWSGYP